MKKFFLSILVLFSVVGYSQNFNGVYTNSEIYGMKLTITNFNKTNGTFNFEMKFNSKLKCINSGMLKAKLEEGKTTVFVYKQTFDGYSGELLYFFFNSDGSLTLNTHNSGPWGFPICDGLNEYPIKLSKIQKSNIKKK